MSNLIRCHWALAIALAVAYLLSGKPLHAAEYYIDQAHPSANDANSGTASLPWKTITKANASLMPGDTVYIKAGTYNQYISPARSGTAGNLITFRNYSNDTVRITGSRYAILLNGRSYIKVHGITFWELTAYLDFYNCQHIEVSHCVFDQTPGVYSGSVWTGSLLRGNCRYNWIHDSVFANFGTYTTDDIGCVLEIGHETSFTDFSDYNLIENNTMYHGGHHVIGIFGRHNVVRNNYFHNENWYNGFGDRCVYTGGQLDVSGWNLFEGNRIAFAGQPPDNTEAAGMSLVTKSNIVRFNCFYGSGGAGIMMSATASYETSPEYNKIYHNTFYKNGQSVNPGTGSEKKSGIGFGNYSSPFTFLGNAIKNNIFYGQATSIGLYRVSLTDQVIAGNFQQTGDPLFVDISTPFNVNNPAIPNFELRSTSPCINNGVALTTVTSASGSGTSFQVADATYFMDGWGIVEGDMIQLHGSTQRARITAINYTTRTITVGSTLTWAQNQGVSLEYTGTAPDIGAYEYGSTQVSTNSAPLVNTTPSLTVGFPTNSVTLRATASDPNRDALTYTWSQVSGPVPAVFSAPNATNTTATVSARGQYVFRFMAWDGQVSSYSDINVTFSPDPNAIGFQAEDGKVDAPFVSANGYIMQNSLTDLTTAGRASYVFNLPEPGDYIVNAVVNAPDDSANSLFVNMDAEPADSTMIWDIPITSGFESRAVAWRGSGAVQSPKVFSLGAGSHTLIVRGREAGVQLDRFELTKVVPVQRPSMRILPSSGRVVVSWPTWATNYVVESRTNLSGTGPWTPVTDPLSVVGTNAVLTNTLRAPATFYRLRK